MGKLLAFLKGLVVNHKVKLALAALGAAVLEYFTGAISALFGS